MGPADQPDYVNAVARLATRLSPLALLDELQRIEQAQGRVRKDERWGPRTLDLDLLLYGDEVIRHERLTVPHYGMKEREFVLLPLAEIAPPWCCPAAPAHRTGCPLPAQWTRDPGRCSRRVEKSRNNVMSKITTTHLQKMKQDGQKITAITAYDATFAKLFDDEGAQVLLIGDSLGMVLQGGDDTLAVSMDEMVYHTRCVVRGTTNALVVTDMPFMSYATPEQTYQNAARLMAAGARMVKMEGGTGCVTPSATSPVTGCRCAAISA
jgi:hypothetical protein